VYYEPTGQGYKIVQPPIGVLVTFIPKGSATVTVNGAKYLEFGGIWYRPFYSGSDVVYQRLRETRQFSFAPFARDAIHDA
jgi:hypothetical protein